jgi:CheY-like chemotaxis protein
MGAFPTTQADGTNVAVLSVALKPDNSLVLSDILNRLADSAGSRWDLIDCRSHQAALRILKKRALPIVLCEHEHGDDSWKQFLNRISDLPDPPRVVVTSRTADEYLWSEALNLGAYDVLATPLDERETVRVLGSAWLHWNKRPPTRLAPVSLQTYGALA